MFLICKAGGTSELSWSVFSLLMCTGNSLMADFVLGVIWISLVRHCHWGCAGALGVPWQPCWIFCLWCFGFSWWLWSESHPTDHCDPQTRGGHFWGESCPLHYGTVLRAFVFIGDSVFMFLCCFEIFARKNLSLYDSRQQSEGFCGLCQASKILTWTIWSSWVCSAEPGNSLKIRRPVKLLLAGSEILTLKRQHPENKQTGNRVFRAVIELLSLALWRDLDLAWFNFVSASLPSLLLCRACQKWKKETKPMAYPISTLSFSYRVQVEKEKNVVYKYWGGDK